MKKPGEIFESRLTGCILKTVAAGSKGRCSCCAYSDKFMIGQDSLTCIMMKDLRREEAGNCSTNSRSDGISVRFEIDKVLYHISEETKKLLVDIQQSTVISQEEKDIYIKTILLVENINHQDENKNTDTEPD